jgi:hypothetical protein
MNHVILIFIEGLVVVLNTCRGYHIIVVNYGTWSMLCVEAHFVTICSNYVPASSWSLLVKCVSLVIKVNINCECLVYARHSDNMYLVIE